MEYIGQVDNKETLADYMEDGRRVYVQALSAFDAAPKEERASRNTGRHAAIPGSLPTPRLIHLSGSRDWTGSVSIMRQTSPASRHEHPTLPRDASTKREKGENKGVGDEAIGESLCYQALRYPVASK